jgi:tRNA threonylcarbamoyladenosine biosynthesis protein TsaE
MPPSGLSDPRREPATRVRDAAAARRAGWKITARTSSARQTVELGAALASVLMPGDVVLLAGDLGSGKTTFAKGLAAGLGVTETVTSPTFTLVRTYECGHPGSRRPPSPVSSLVHADLFRLEHLREVVDLAIDEPLEEGAVALVEWGDVAVPVLGRDALTVRIEHCATSGQGNAGVPDQGEDAAPAARGFTFSAPTAWDSRRRMLLDVLAPLGEEASEPAPE